MSILMLDFGYDKNFEQKIWNENMKSDLRNPSEENFEKYLNAFENSNTKLHSNYIFLETYFSQLSNSGVLDSPKGQKLRKKYDKIIKPYIKNFLIFSIENSLEKGIESLEKDFELFLQLKKLYHDREYKNLIEENIVLYFLENFSKKIEKSFKDKEFLSETKNLLILTKISKILGADGLIVFTDIESKILASAWENIFETANIDHFETIKFLDEVLEQLVQIQVGKDQLFLLSGYGKDIENFLYGKEKRFGIGKMHQNTPRTIEFDIEKYQKIVENKKKGFSAAGYNFY